MGFQSISVNIWTCYTMQMLIERQANSVTSYYSSFTYSNAYAIFLHKLCFCSISVAFKYVYD